MHPPTKLEDIPPSVVGLEVALPHLEGALPLSGADRPRFGLALDDFQDKLRDPGHDARALSKIARALGSRAPALPRRASAFGRGARAAPSRAREKIRRRRPTKSTSFSFGNESATPRKKSPTKRSSTFSWKRSHKAFPSASARTESPSSKKKPKSASESVLERLFRNARAGLGNAEARLSNPRPWFGKSRASLGISGSSRACPRASGRKATRFRTKSRSSMPGSSTSMSKPGRSTSKSSSSIFEPGSSTTLSPTVVSRKWDARQRLKRRPTDSPIWASVRAIDSLAACDAGIRRDCCPST